MPLRKSDLRYDIRRIVDWVAGVVDVPPCPYPGTASFTAEDSRYFFGRGGDTDRLVALVDTNPVVVVAGASGSGKSSLVHAGLLPRINCRVVTFRPVLADEPDRMLRNAVRGITTWDGPLDVDTAPQLAERLVEAAGRPVLIVIDQFEEIAANDPGKAVALFDLVHATAAGGVRAVFTMRSGNFDDVASSALGTVHDTATLLLRPLDRAGLTEAIEGPAREAGDFEFAPGLVNAILKEIDMAPGQQALLGFTLRRLWLEGENGALSHEAYLDMGGVDGALSQHADLIYEQLDGHDRKLMRRLLTQLARPIEDADTFAMSPQRFADLDPPFQEMAMRLSLSDSGRLVAIREDTGQPAVVALAHAALMHKWKRLNDWLVEDREFLTWLSHLNVLVTKHAGLHGAELGAARKWLRSHGDQFNQKQRDHVLRSLHRRRWFRTGLSTLLVLTLLAGAGAMVAARVAFTLRDAAVSRQVAATAADIRSRDPALSTQLALAAYRLAPTEEAFGTLLTTFASPYANRLTTHTGIVDAVAVRPDGAVQDGAVWLWDAREPHRPRPVGRFDGLFRSLAFSADGKTLAAGGADHFVHLMDMSDPANPVERLRLPELSGQVISLAFGPEFLVVAGADRIARLWDTSVTPVELATLNQATVVAISHDGRTLAAGADGVVRRWDISTPDTPVPLLQVTHKETVLAVAFSPNGRTLVSAGHETLRLWDVTAPTPVQAHLVFWRDRKITTAAFSPDGTTLATGRDDGELWLWNVTDPSHRLFRRSVYTGAGEPITSAAFTPDGQHILAASMYNTARVWDLPPPALRAHTGHVFHTTYRGDGKVLATASLDRTAKLWDTTDPARPSLLATLSGHKNNVDAAVFSPKGTLVATASFDGTAQLWDVTNPRAPEQLAVLPGGHSDGIVTTAFTPDGHTLATGSFDGTVRLWDISDPGNPRRLTELDFPSKQILSVAFNTDGTMLAAGTRYGTVDLWNLADRTKPIYAATMLGVHSGGVEAITFRPDGHTMTTASSDNFVRQWELAPERIAQRVCAVAYPRMTAAQWAQYVPDLSYEPPCP